MTVEVEEATTLLKDLYEELSRLESLAKNWYLKNYEHLDQCCDSLGLTRERLHRAREGNEPILLAIGRLKTRTSHILGVLMTEGLEGVEKEYGLRL